MLYYILALAPMFTCFFWFLTLAVDKDHRTRARNMLTLFMLITTLHFLGQAIYCYMDYELTAIYDPVYTFTTCLIFPVYYLYIKTLTEPERLSIRSLLILLPPLIIFLTYLTLSIVMSREEMIDFARLRLYWEGSFHDLSVTGQIQSIVTTILGVVFDIQIILVAWFGVRKIRKYYNELKEYYSNPDEKFLAPVKGLLYCFVAASAASFIFNTVGRAWFITNSIWLVFLASVSFVTMLFSVGFVGFRQPFSIDDMVKDQREGDLKESENISSNIPGTEIIKNRLTDIMENDKIYLRSDLKITDIALALGTNRAYVSRILNRDLDTSFSDWINSYRIKHAKTLLKTQNDFLSMAEIAFSSGFSSESSFYRIFKQLEGITPTIWKKTFDT